MNASVAEISITPRTGLDMTGYIARQGPANGVHSRLFARALVFMDDHWGRVAILTADLIGLHGAFVQRVRRAIGEAIKLPPDHILITCSHTHAAPATMHLQDCGEVSERYMEKLEKALVKVAYEANRYLRTAYLEVGHGAVNSGVHNRRTPGDVIDPDLTILRVVDAVSSPISIVLNYACHPTTLEATNRRMSAEYPGYVIDKLQKAEGTLHFRKHTSGCLPMFITGAIGDVGPVTRGQESLTQIGEALTAETLRCLPTRKQRQPDCDIKVATQKIQLPLLPQPSLAEWEQIARQWQETETAASIPLLASHPKIPIAMRHWSQRMLDETRTGKARSHVITEVQVFRFGSIAFVSAPGELFVELGLQIKAAAKQAGLAEHIFLCGFANDNIGYIPTRRAYQYGGYEINEAYKYYGYPTALAPEAGEQYVATVIELLQSTQKS